MAPAKDRLGPEGCWAGAQSKRLRSIMGRCGGQPGRFRALRQQRLRMFYARNNHNKPCY